MTIESDIKSTPDGVREWKRAYAILELTELICETMETAGIDRDELASRLGVTIRSVDSILDGRELTIRQAADVFTAMGYTLDFTASKGD